LRFVVQKHGATRLHWDLRLEMGNVLRSWAVPRGPCLDPSVKRMAVLTEDHPLEYLDYEGVIPEENYGAGPMIVWDRGAWIPLEDGLDGFENGKLLFELHGYKLRGVWTLVRTKGANGRQWLLIKKPDALAKPGEDSGFDESSILSGATVEQLREHIDRRAPISERLAALGVPRARVKLDDGPMLAEPRDRPPSGANWYFELKYDGFRLMASRRGDAVALAYRSGRVTTHCYPELVRTLAALPWQSFVLDGEVVVLDDDGHPNFERLQKRAQLAKVQEIERATLEHPATYFVFDLLELDEHDLRRVPLRERKQLLQAIVPVAGPIRYADHFEGSGQQLLERVVGIGLEGIVAKRGDSSYRSGRSSDWIKIRANHSNEFVIVGFTRPQGTRSGFGALHLAAYVRGRLTYMGRVGTGFRDAELRRLHSELEARIIDAPACEGAIPRGREHSFVRPELVCEVRFREVTSDGLLRLPVFLRMRPDKAPHECTLEGSGGDTPAESHADEPARPTLVSTSASQDNGPVREPFAISNPDKVFWPENGYTKSDLVAFYREISPWLLPYLRDRPLVLTRYPDGIHGKSFFQKNAPPFASKHARTAVLWSEERRREVEHFVCDDLDSLLYVINLASIPLHIWGSRLTDLQHPDWCILDLDPKGAPLVHVVQIARAIKDVCDEVELPSFVKTSGSTGLHVLFPLAGQCTFEQCRTLARIFAQIIAERMPTIATIERNIARRRGRVYVDFGQNGHGRLLVAPFSVRPLPGAPVSTPLSWSEVTKKLSLERYTIATMPARMRKLADDPMRDVLRASTDLGAVLARLAQRLAP